MHDSEPDESVVDNVTVAASWPESLRPFGDGYPAAGDPCRRVGESAATIDWLDHTADLVGCPTEEAAKTLGGRIVGKVEGITLVSVPRGDANAGMSENGASGDTSGDAKVAGTDYHATAELPCSVTGGATDRNCPAGVKRNALDDGVTVVEVTRPDGRKRAIFFKDGKPFSADSAESDGSAAYQFSFTQQADEFLISYGPERYRIPAVFVLGD
jgi:hypothetical protein